MVTVGNGLLITSVEAAEVPPPGVGFVTVMEAEPAAAISAARIVAVTWLPLLSVVARGLPLKFTTDVEIKFVPLTIRENVAPPAVVALGTNEVIVGTGFPPPVPVSVKVTEFEVAPPGFVTVTPGVPGLAVSVAATTATRNVEVTNSVGSALEPKLTVAPFKKFVPETLRTTVPDPAAAVVGDIEVMVTEVALLTVNETEFDGPPPGVGFVTMTAGVPEAATSAARIAAVSCVVLTKVVVRAAPPKLTTEVGVKPEPFTVNVNAREPAIALAG